MVGLGQAVSGSTEDSSRHPRFSDYPVKSFHHGRTAHVSPLYARRAKTGVWEAGKGRADFAGHFIVAVGSCGTSCRSISVIDAKTGRVYHFGHTLIVSAKEKRPAVEYRLNSGLMILRGARNEKQSDRGTHYYEFRDGRFVHLFSTRVSLAPTPSSTSQTAAAAS
jgi:hypothetical protein